MSKQTSFKTGGIASYALFPQTINELECEITFLKKNNIPYIILGRGSNVLVSDEGISDVVIFTEKLKKITREGNVVTALCGNSLIDVSNFAMKNALSGMEFMAGIPGSVGGGVYMNAGAYGNEISDIIIDVRAIDSDGHVKNYTKADMNLKYRSSAFMENNDVIISASFELTDGFLDDIKSQMVNLNHLRREKQPLEYPSAGSTFKRPDGNFAGKLIEDSGLKGYSIGGAMVSEKHCGFIINYSNATSSDIYNLIKYVQKVVFDKYKILLEPEVRLLGCFKDEL